MYEDGGCIDDSGGVPRHFTPPGAGGWDKGFLLLKHGLAEQ